MDGISLTATNSSVFRFCVTPFSHPGRLGNLSFPRKPRKLLVFASKDGVNLDQWDQMELKFGKLLGEDPKLTMAKIIGRKSNPDMSNLEIEKSFTKNKGKPLDEGVVEVPFDGSAEGRTLVSLNGVNLVRPVPKKGVKFEVSDKPRESNKRKLFGVNKPIQPSAKAVEDTRPTTPDVILRRPSVFSEDDEGTKESSKLRIRPNLSLKMGKEQKKERFTDMTLVRRPEPINVNPDKAKEPSGDSAAEVTTDMGKNSVESASLSTGLTNDVEFLEKQQMLNLELDTDGEQEASGQNLGSSSVNDLSLTKQMENGKAHSLDQILGTGDVSLSSGLTGLQPPERKDIGSAEKSPFTIEASETFLTDSDSKISMEAALHKPSRLDRPVKGKPNTSEEEKVLVNPESYGNGAELEDLPATSPIKEREVTDWARAEDLVKTGGREEVELISCSTRGFVVSFGSLIGFLPYRNLANKWKYLAFESWLRRKGLDPSTYKQNLGIIGSYEATSKSTSLDVSKDPQIISKVEGEISSDMKLEDLLMKYDEEKLKFLTSFVGQKIKVNVVLADRISRRLIFSVKPKEKEESVEKKRSLMAKLNIGDIVKCCIKKITYFGIFVELEGVPALIHQTEVSWDATLDPASYFKIGQIVEAKVHQLDFSLERIFLSLKELTPDPLIEALEAVVGDHDSLDGRLQAAEADTEWADVESLVKELQQFEGIQSASKGRFFFSPGLAPTFQVYMASMFENQYKLLARAGNKVQEVIVETSLGKEEMKSAILTCTSRVE